MNEKDYTGFVYIWFDRKKKYYCIGSHFGTLNDGYSSSTGIFPRAFKKRPEDFTRRIIKFCTGDRKEILQEEQYYLNMIKEEELFISSNLKAKTVRYYNIKKTASGLSSDEARHYKNIFYASEAGKTRREELSRIFKENNPSKKGNVPWNKGIKTPEHSEKMKQFYENFEWNENERNKMKEKSALYWNNPNRKKRPNDLSDEAKAKIENKKWATEEYLNKKRTQGDIAKELGCSIPLVNHYLKKHNIKSNYNVRTYRVYLPDGSSQVVDNLSQFCKDHHLDQGNMVSVASGRLKQYKGYKVVRL